MKVVASDYRKEQLYIIQANARAIYLLYYSLSDKEYEKIATCKTVKEI